MTHKNYKITKQDKTLVKRAVKKMLKDIAKNLELSGIGGDPYRWSSEEIEDIILDQVGDAIKLKSTA